MDECRYDSWGFVFYRTDYESDAACDRFKDVITRCVHESIDRSDTPKLAESQRWTFFDDRAAFQGASKAILHQHFKQWVQND